MAGTVAHGGFGSAAQQVFGLEHLRAAIFHAHFVELLRKCPRPIERPTDKLTNKELKLAVDRFIDSLAPLYDVYGYRSATAWDELVRRPDMLAFHLQESYQITNIGFEEPFSFRDGCGTMPMGGASNFGGRPARPLRNIAGLVGPYDRYQGLYYNRIMDAVVRQADETPPMLLHIWPRDSQTSQMWKWFFGRPQLMADSECPLLPAVNLLELGENTAVVTHSPPRAASISYWRTIISIRRRLERVRDAFSAMEWLHRHDVSLNYIGRCEDTFVASYAQRVGAEKIIATPAGNPERFAFEEILPEQPRVSFPFGPPNGPPPGLPWCVPTAVHDARVAGPRLWLYDLTHASTSDDCSVAHPTGRSKQDWESIVFKFQDYSQRSYYQPAVPPEEAALAKRPEWSAGPPHDVRTLPFCRFKRDVWSMARMFIVGEFMDFGSGDLVAHLDRLCSTEDAQRYERVFSVNPKRFMSYPDGQGPEDPEFWDTSNDDLSPAVMPEDLRQLFLDMLETDPAKRPTAQEAARRATQIHDREVPRIVKVYEAGIALQPPSDLFPWPQNKLQEAAYVEEIRSEYPHSRLIMEHARGRYLNVTEKNEWQLEDE